MARHITDEEKRKKGTFDKRFSKETKAQEQVATILTFPAMSEIPKSSFPLNAGGKRTFEYYTKALKDRGLLTKVSFEKVDTLALIDHVIHKRMNAGKEPAIQSLDKRRILLTWLEGLNVNESVISGQTKKSAFASFGFPNRLQTPEAHMARRTRRKRKG